MVQILLKARTDPSIYKFTHWIMQTFHLSFESCITSSWTTPTEPPEIHPVHPKKAQKYQEGRPDYPGHKSFPEFCGFAAQMRDLSVDFKYKMNRYVPLKINQRKVKLAKWIHTHSHYLSHVSWRSLHSQSRQMEMRARRVDLPGSEEVTHWYTCK